MCRQLPNLSPAAVTAALVVLAALATADRSHIATAQPVAAPPAPDAAWAELAPHFSPPAAYVGRLGAYRSPLRFDDGSPVRTADDWSRRRQEILAYWHGAMGAWPPVIDKPAVEYLGRADRGEGVIQHKVRVEVARRAPRPPATPTAPSAAAGATRATITAADDATGSQRLDGYLLVPPGAGPFPAVFVPFYDPETSAGLVGDPKKQHRDFAWQLARRGFVTLSLGSPGGDARKPDTADHPLQPMSYLAYVAANAYQVLAALPSVDPARVGVVGHSYGGKWAMFASCLYDKYAAAAWSDPGVVWDEAKPSVNYWEPWYLGRDPADPRPKPGGLVTAANPRTGAYKALVGAGRDLHELHALMAPRPFLVSGGSEDGPDRWVALNHAVAVNALLGRVGRVGMTNRPAHSPTAESNEVIYRFFELALRSDARRSDAGRPVPPPAGGK
jgi:dienelactone hydrolase